MNKLSLKMKLAVGFGILLLLLTGTGGFNYFATARLVKKVEDAADDLKKKQFSTEIELSIRTQLADVNDYVFTDDDNARQRYETDKQKLKTQLTELSRFLTGEDRKIYEPIGQNTDKAWALIDEEIGLKKAGKIKEAEQLAYGDRAEHVQKDLGAALGALETMENNLVQASELGEHQTETSDEIITISLIISGLVIGVVVASLIARSVSGAISRMLSMIQEIAANNLAVADMEVTSKDEIGQAGMALNQMKNRLHEVIQSIASTATHVASASEELSSTSQQISANSEETSAQANVVSTAAQTVSQNLQTVATGAEEMGASIKEIAKNATEAAKVATGAVKVAETTTTIW